MSKKLNFKKVNAEIIKLKEGENFVGNLTQTSMRDWLDKETGEMTQIKQYHFDLLNEEGEEVGKGIYFGDSGFQNAMSMAGIKDGDIVMVEKLAKASLGSGRTVNNYSIFKAE